MSFPLHSSDNNALLAPSQWHQVPPPEFKKTFGDWEIDPENSLKVLDENGDPLVVYHGTNLEFNSFDMSQAGKFDNVNHAYSVEIEEIT